MGSVNDLYSPDPRVDASFREARHQTYKVFRLGLVRMMLDDTFLGRAAWYR
nr:hypothetical protein [Labedella populi]